MLLNNLVLAIAALMLCVAMYKSHSAQDGRFIFACAGDDSDMKIAGFEKKNEATISDDADQLAELIKAERENGNVEKAKRIAVGFVDMIFAENKFITPTQDDTIKNQIQLLITFTADLCLENGLPNSILAQSAQNLFYEQIRLRDSEYYDEIARSGAFSMYLLCIRSEVSNSGAIGCEFANLCKQDDSEEYKKLGQDIFEECLKECAQKIAAAKLVK